MAENELKDLFTGGYCSNNNTKEEKAENKFLLIPGQCEKSNSTNIIRWKSTLAQFLACSALCFTSISIGMMIGFPTIAIGELRTSNQEFTLNENEASWFGSLLYLLQPLCSVLGGIIHPYVGCKNGLTITFIPQIFGWLLICFAKSVFFLYLAVILFGVSAGSLEAPALAYMGEITQPQLRSMIVGMTSIAFSGGFLFVYLLGSIFTWKTVAMICLAIPIVAVISIYFIPESPIWLLSKNRKEEALKSLCWLRGWASPAYVQFEYDGMCQYIDLSRLSHRKKEGSKNSVWKKFKKSLRLLCRPAIRTPLFLIMMGHFACHTSTLTGMRSYLIEILGSMQIPIKPQLFTFLNSILMICGGVVCFSSVKYMGKRSILLISLMICSLMCIVLGWYTVYMHQLNAIWIPLTAMLILHLAMTFGLYPIPWMLTSEVFPLKGRSMGVGLAAASYYVIGFSFSKTFYSLSELIGQSGCFFFYGICGLLSFVFMYFRLPETEGKTLAEVEEHFSKPSKKRKTIIA